MTNQDEWMRVHQGDLLYTWGQVWECGDDECGCEQAQIVSYYQNKVIRNARVPVVDWAGEFHTDHEPGADAELAAYRRRLRAEDPDREAQIRWQEGVDYGVIAP